jgi:hypothetical protein
MSRLSRFLEDLGASFPFPLFWSKFKPNYLAILTQTLTLTLLKMKEEKQKQFYQKQTY